MINEYCSNNEHRVIKDPPPPPPSVSIETILISGVHILFLSADFIGLEFFEPRRLRPYFEINGLTRLP